MAKRTDLAFNVRWLPFQLNADAAPQANKLEMYMKKFGRSKEQTMAMAGGMQEKFAAAGLPFNFKETDLTGNTFDAHRLMTAAYEKGGAGTQDQVCESLFQSYFVEGRAPSDPAVLKAAAEAAGVDFDASTAKAKTTEEMEVGRRLGVGGVPHFVIYEEGSTNKKQVGGAQPPEELANVFSQVSR